jgi:adenylate cyclase
LIDAETGAHIWADRFDTDRSNLASAQREITGRLARTLHLELMEAASRQIDEGRAFNLDARDFVIRGWAWYHRGLLASNLEQAWEAFGQALRLEPQSGAAKIGLASVLVERISLGLSSTREDDLEIMEKLLVAALESERNDSMLHTVVGRLRRFQNRFEESKIAFERAIALNSNNAHAVLQVGFSLNIMADPAAAIPYFERSIALNPHTPGLHYILHGLGDAYLFLGNLDQAARILRQANALNSNYYLVPLHLAAALALQGEISEADIALARALRLRPDICSLADLHRLHPPYGNPKYAAMAAKTLDEGLRRAGLPER